MFSLKYFLSLTLTALLAVGASPLNRHSSKNTLHFATRINLDARGTLSTIADKDRARVRAMKRASHPRKRGGKSFDVTNVDVIYTAQVGIGDPPSYYSLLIDTGSSITWLGANQSRPYVPTNKSINTGNPVSVNYSIGSFAGEEWLDTVTLSPNLVIKNQSIGAASSSSGLEGLDGILGVGPIDLTIGTVANTITVPTVTDNLYTQKVISEEVLGILFVPSSQLSSDGELTFGGFDSSAITSSVNYVPITKTPPASYYWGIEQSISYGNQVILSTTAGVVDTGTSLILIATDAFEKYRDATGGVLDSTTGLLSITPAQYSKLKTLTFKVGGKSYNLTPNGQIWPRTLNTAIGGSSTVIYLIVNDIGTPSGSGLDFINAYTFLERFYSVIDITHGRVGFATTEYTHAETN